MQGVDDLFEGAARQIGTANASGEKCVSGDQFLLAGKIKTDAALGMSGCEKYIRGERAGLHRVGLSDVLINLHFARRRYADPCGLDIEHLKQFVVILVEQDGCARGGSQFHRAAYVIDVSMGDDDLFYLQVMLLNQRKYALDFIARIDHHGLVRGLVSDDRAVAL